MIPLIERAVAAGCERVQLTLETKTGVWSAIGGRNSAKGLGYGRSPEEALVRMLASIEAERRSGR